MSAAERWLRERLAEAPPELLERMVTALPGSSLPVANALAEGALALLEQLAARPGGREDAWPLLAADGLLTHALEAQAELEPEGISALAERIGAAGRIGALAGRLHPAGG